MSGVTSSPMSANSTRRNPRLGRERVDNQPTSFEANEQFRIFHRFRNIADTDQIVFKFASANPVNIMERKINLWQGGREYLVIPDDGSYGAVDAQLTTSVQVRTVNGNLNDSQLPVHPTSGVTVSLGIASGLFTISDTDQFPNGDAVRTDGNANRANNSLLTSPNMSGVAAGQAFYLVFIGIGATATSGHFTVQWEEVFS